MNDRAHQVHELKATVLQLAELVADPDRGDETFDSYLSWIGKLHQKYSWSNTALILFRCPDASYVAGYKGWKKLGRHVRKGERGISIFVPITFAARVETDPVTGEEREVRPRPMFGIRKVWDISQTGGSGVIPNFKPDLGDDAQPLFAAAVGFANEKGIAVEVRPIFGSTNGYSQGGKIAINSSRPVGVQAQTILHEVAHELQDHAKAVAHTTNALREGEAEATAVAVLRHFGIDGTLDNAAAYIRQHGATPELLLQSLSRICKTARTMIDGISPLLTVDQVDQLQRCASLVGAETETVR